MNQCFPFRILQNFSSVHRTLRFHTVGGWVSWRNVSGSKTYPSHILKSCDHLFWCWLFLTQLCAVPTRQIFPTKRVLVENKEKWIFVTNQLSLYRQEVNQEIPAYASSLPVAAYWSDNKCHLFHFVLLFCTPFFCNFSIF